MIPLRMENPNVIIPFLGKRIPLPWNIIKELYIIMIIHHYKTCFITCLQNTWLVCQTSRRVVYRTRVFNVCSVRHWFYTTNHSGFASPWKFNFLKKYARTFSWKCKKPQRQSLFFCAKCSWQCLQWAWTFCGNCFPISTAKSRWKSVPCTLFVSMCISQDPWRALRSKLISRFWYKSLMRKCKTIQ